MQRMGGGGRGDREEHAQKPLTLGSRHDDTYPHNRTIHYQQEVVHYGLCDSPALPHLQSQINRWLS